jgi:hypothetical protein
MRERCEVLTYSCELGFLDDISLKKVVTTVSTIDDPRVSVSLLF